MQDVIDKIRSAEKSGMKSEDRQRKKQKLCCHRKK